VLIFVETFKNKFMKHLIKKVLIKSTVLPEIQNEYTPPMHINDAVRKQFFTSYNVELVNRLRDIKLNQL
jgi:hypothetical protein